MNNNTVLVLAPHTDDGELGCGGTIARLIEEEKSVYYAGFSTAEESIPKGLRRDILKEEVKDAVRILGINSENLILFSHKVRRFSDDRQNILEDMVSLNKAFRPDIVFLPSSDDTHQDHRVISSEGFRAFKKCTILGYELPWNNCNFNVQAFVRIEEKHIAKKVSALKSYKSQKERSYMQESFIKGLAEVRGIQANCQTAEAFEVIRWII